MNGDEQIRSAEKIIIHPLFKLPDAENDLAIIKVSSIEYNRNFPWQSYFDSMNLFTKVLENQNQPNLTNANLFALVGCSSCFQL